MGPANWDRYQGKAASRGPASASEHVEVPPSGAHVSLSDLARDPSTLPPRIDPEDVRSDAFDSDDVFVTPDPTKYAPGTTYLSPKEVAEEMAKGNGVRWGDLKRTLKAVPAEAQAALVAQLRKKQLQEDFFVTLEDGRKVSAWDLMQFVHDNPERDKLSEGGRRRIPSLDPRDPAAPLQLPPLDPELRSAGKPELELGGEEAERMGVDWGMVGGGTLWKRRPTRWLRGIDGVKDWEVEVYGHEVLTNLVLGRKYCRRSPWDVVADPQYKADVLRCGPLLGMTFLLKAARDMSTAEVARTWSGRLRDHLQRQAPLQLPCQVREIPDDPYDLNGASNQWALAVADAMAGREQPSSGGSGRGGGAAHPASASGRDGSGPEPGAQPQPDELGVSWRTMDAVEHRQSVRDALDLAEALPRALSDPSFAQAGTQLLDPKGATWLQGSTLWVTLSAGGTVLVQAESPGAVGEAEKYLLAAVRNEALSGAVMDMMLGPQPLDPAMAHAARTGMLLHTYGFKTGNTDNDPNHPMLFDPVRLPAVPADPRKFRLQRAGMPLPGTVLTDIGDAAMLRSIHSLIAQAGDAAAAAAEQARLRPSPAATADVAAPADGEEAGAAADAASAGAASPGSREAAASAAAREAADRVLSQGLARLGPGAAALMQRLALAAAAGTTGTHAAAVGASAGTPAGGRDLFSLARSLDGGQC